MLRRFSFGLLPLVLVGAACLMGAGAAPPEGGGCCGTGEEEKSKKGTYDTYVCPIYKVADHGSYSTWYAEGCFGSYMALDTTMGPGNCHDPAKANCTKYAYSPRALVRSWGAAKQTYDDSVKRGIFRKASKKDVIPAESRLHVIPVVEPQLVRLQTAAGKDQYVALILYLNLAMPPGRPHLVVATGREVTDPVQATWPTIPYGDITEVNMQVVRIKYGQLEYQVILDPDTRIGEKAAPPP